MIKKPILSIDSFELQALHGYVDRYVWLFDTMPNIRKSKINEQLNGVPDKESLNDLEIERAIDDQFFDLMRISSFNLLLVHSYNIFIHKLNDACYKFQIQFELVDFKEYTKGLKKGSDLNKLNYYLTKVCGIDMTKLKVLFDKIENYRELRNIIVHGLLKSPNELSLVQEKLISDDRIIYEYGEFSIIGMSLIHELIDHVCNYIETIGFEFEMKKSINKGQRLWD